MSSLLKARRNYSGNQTCPNWAELIPNLLYFISKKLCDISNFIMFRAVCKAWRDATDLSDPPPQFPCLIDCLYYRDSTLHIYSLASQRTYTSFVQNTSFYGPANQYVLMRSHSSSRFYYMNPLTRVKKNISYAPLYDLDLDYVVFSSRNEQFVMAKYHENNDVFYFKKPDQDKWTSMTVMALRSAAYYENQYFLLKRQRCFFLKRYRIMVIDENGKPKLLGIPLPSNGLTYLIATTDSLLVVSAVMGHLMDLKKFQFEVHRLDNYPQNPHWTKLSGIGNIMLFLDRYNGFSLNASDYSGFKGNCIYFIARDNSSRHGITHVIGRFDMELNKVEELSGPAWIGERNFSEVTWFVPSI